MVDPDSFPVPAWVVLSDAPDNSAGLNVEGPAVNVAITVADPTEPSLPAAAAITTESLIFPYTIKLPLAVGVLSQFVEGTISAASNPAQVIYALSTSIDLLGERNFLAVSMRQLTSAALNIQAQSVESGTCADQYRLVEAQSGSSASDAIPVVIVHGWEPMIGTCAGWRSRFELDEQGTGLINAIAANDVSSRISLWRFTYPTFNSIELAATHLADSIANRWPTGRVILIGHSMGGLVARAAVEMKGLGDRARVLTLGTPHHGSPLADVATWALLALEFRSPVLGSLFPLRTDGLSDLRPGRGSNFISRLTAASNVSRLNNYYTFAGDVNSVTITQPSKKIYEATVRLLADPSDAVVPVASAFLAGTNQMTDFGVGYDHSEILNGHFDGTTFPCQGTGACDEPLFDRIVSILRSLAPPPLPIGFSDSFSSGLGNWEVRNADNFGSWSAATGELIGDYNISCGSPGCHQAQLILAPQHQPSGDWRAEIQSGFVQAYCCVNGGAVVNFAKFVLWVSNTEKEAINIGGAWQGSVAPATMNTVNVAYARWPWTELANLHPTVPVWNPNDWQTAAIEKRGNQYTFFFNGVQVYTVTRTFSSTPRIGFSTYGRVRMDNFRITPLTPSALAGRD